MARQSFDEKTPGSEQQLSELSVMGTAESPQVLHEKKNPMTLMNSRSALVGWLILCFSTGPTSSVAFTYVAAAIQSAANLIGHVPGSEKACVRQGTINCVVRFGAGEVDYLSYLLYLKAIGRAIEGVMVIMISGLADYSYYRKTLMMASIFFFGLLALPFVVLTGNTYGALTALSVLYCGMTAVQGVYTVVEASYIPIFMRSVGWETPGRRLGNTGEVDQPPRKEPIHNELVKGARVSVLGLVASNVGSLLALLIGIVLTYTRGSYVTAGYYDFLLSITIAGCLTIVFAVLGGSLLPSIPGMAQPESRSILLVSFQRWIRLLRAAPQYPEAFKLCIGWILWNTGYSNFLSIISALFLEVSGLKSGDGTYTVWTFTNVIFACTGSLGWMFLFPHIKVSIKYWAYIFLSINILCVLWGTIGISDHVTIGYKHVAEFWIEQVLFMSTSSALRSHNRVLYAMMLPVGAEAQFFGLEITLDLATGWINPLVQGVIQNNTHNLRFPMLPTLFLMLVALLLYIWVDVDKGVKEAEQELK